MARSAFRCAKCNRTFSMAAHLARHNNAVHGMGRRKSAGRRSRGSQRASRPAGSGRRSAITLASDGVSESRGQVLSYMTAYRDELMAQRDSIDAELVGIDNAMSVMGSGSMLIPTGPRRGRPSGSGGRKGGTLRSAVVRVLRQKGGPMSPAEIADAVIKSGHKTRAANLTKAVSNALPKIGEVKKVDRGQYRA